MNDVFYFSPTNLQIEDIAQAAHAAGFQDIFAVDTEQALSARAASGYLIEVYKVQIDKEFGEVQDLQVLRETHVVSGFVFSHRRATLPAILDLLRRLLAVHGGWVGNDSDAFAPRFSIQNLNNFHYGPDIFNP